MATQDSWDQPCSDAHLVELARLIVQWEEVAHSLGLTEIDVEDIVRRYPYSAPAQRVAMLRTWREKHGADATYTRLATAFQQCNKQDLLEKITELTAEESESPLPATPASATQMHVRDAELVSQPSIMHAETSTLGFQKVFQQQLPTITASVQQPLSPSLQQYAKYLKQLYSKKTTPVFDKELGLLRVKAKSFINIALVHKESTEDDDKDEMLMDKLHGYVDEIEKKKTKLSFNDVCKCENGSSLARSVLVEGAPGVGKTTFATELCKQWASEKLLQEWNIVVMVKLRDERTRAAKNIYDLLYYPDNDIRQKMAKELVCQHGEGLLLILDGYDELSESQRYFESVIQQIMSRELLCLATLMITSRPLATKTLDSSFQQSIDQHIEVIGFTKKNVKEFIKSACEDKPELMSDFKSYLATNPFSSSLMYNPLQCAVVTNIYYSHWVCGKKGYAPNTLTELYTSLVHTMLLRYLAEHHKNENLRIKDLTDLPDDLKQHLEAVTSLAAKGIEKCQYVFDEDDDGIPSDTLGLMQREEVVRIGIGKSTSYYFLHLTLQEYLAALHFIDQSGFSQELLLAENSLFSLKTFLKHYGEKRKSFLAVHWPVALFIAGRTKLSGISTDLLQTGLTHNTHKHITYVNVSLLHLLYETQCPELIQSTLVTNEQYLSVSGNSALDWFVIGYCIATSASRWQVRKQSRKVITQDHINQLGMGLNLGFRTSCKNGFIAFLQITDKSWIEISNILRWLQMHTKSVTELKLAGQLRRKITKQKLSDCTEAKLPATCVIYPVLETLDIECAKTNFSPFIWNIIRSQTQNSLQTLLLNLCHFNSEATGLLLHVLQSANCNVQNLTLSECTITIPHSTQHKKHKKRKKPISLQEHKLEFKLETADGKVSLNVTSSSAAVSHVLLQPLFCADTLNEMTIELDPPSSAILNIVTSQYPMLELLQINKNPKDIWTSDKCCLSSSVFSFSSQQNSLDKLLVHQCKFDSEATRLLIRSLQSSHSKLSELTLDSCEFSILDDGILYSLPLFELKHTETFSLNVSGSSQSISHLLSQPHFYTNELTEMTVNFNDLYVKESFPLEIIILQYPILEKLEIAGDFYFRRWYSDVYLNLEQNNLNILSLTECRFNSETTKSLSNFLQSQHCRLHHLTIRRCVLSDETSSYELTELMFDNDRKYLNLIGSIYALSQMLSQTYFYASKLTEIIIQPELSATKEPLKIVTTQYSMLEKLSIREDWLSPDGKDVLMICPTSFTLSSQPNSLHTLLLKCCEFSTEAIGSLISCLQSPHCRLEKLTLTMCSFFCLGCSKYEETALELYKSYKKTGRMSLTVQGSSCIISQFLPLLNFFARTVGRLSIVFMPRQPVRNFEITILISELSKYTSLDSLHVTGCSDSSSSFPFSTNISPVPDFSLLETVPSFLTLKGITLTNEAVSSLIQELKSPHCRLCSLAVERCIISVQDYTHLIMAITSCTSIKHLSIDIISDTVLLTELTDGLKQNKTLETLGIYDNRCIVSTSKDNFTNDQLQVLITSVDSSAIEVLWLSEHNKRRIWAYPFTRKNIKIKWYDFFLGIFNYNPFSADH